MICPRRVQPEANSTPKPWEGTGHLARISAARKSKLAQVPGFLPNRFHPFNAPKLGHKPALPGSASQPSPVSYQNRAFSLYCSSMWYATN
ncbi:unnamed protein product [Linum trigynum]|uniref:Uncharacterized protein n=1 Tax=Linum trigynum TaxID=586398 RepID=A0AAV2GA70_9ROSI